MKAPCARLRRVDFNDEPGTGHGDDDQSKRLDAAPRSFHHDQAL
jgi:hypothetical protein